MTDERDKADERDAAEPEDRITAAAIRYDPADDSAPRLVAKGFGFVAEKIIEAAKRHGIPVHVDRDLTALLAKLKLESEIPRELYRAVAEVLAVIYRVNRESGATPEGPA